jgi:hypothetical protein
MSYGLKILGADGGVMIWDEGDYPIFVMKLTDSHIAVTGDGSGSSTLYLRYDFTLPTTFVSSTKVFPFVYTGSYYVGISSLENTSGRNWQLNMFSSDISTTAKQTIEIYLFAGTSNYSTTPSGWGFTCRNLSGDYIFNADIDKPLWAKGFGVVKNTASSSNISYSDTGVHDTTGTAHLVSGLTKPAGMPVLSGFCVRSKKYNWSGCSPNQRHRHDIKLLLTKFTTTQSYTGWASNGYKALLEGLPWDYNGFYHCYYNPINGTDELYRDEYTTAIIDGADYD